MRVLLCAVVASSAICGVARETAIYQGKLTSQLNSNDFAITNAPLPVADGDVANKKYVDERDANITNNVIPQVVIPQVVSRQYVETLGAVTTNASGRVEAPISFGEDEFHDPVLSIRNGEMTIGDARPLYVGPNGDGAVCIGAANDPTLASLTIGSNLMWEERHPNLYSGLLWDWHTNAYTRVEADAAMYNSVSNALWQTPATPRYLPMESFYQNAGTAAYLGSLGIYTSGNLITDSWGSFGVYDPQMYFSYVSLPTYLSSRESSVLDVAATNAAAVADAAVANAVTTYAATNAIVALNQSVQYVVANGTPLTILAPSAESGHCRDWLVYINATAATPLDFGALDGIIGADASVTNACAANKVTMLCITEMTANTFVIGRQELTAVK